MLINDQPAIVLPDAAVRMGAVLPERGRRRRKCRQADIYKGVLPFIAMQERDADAGVLLPANCHLAAEGNRLVRVRAGCPA